MNKFRDLPLKYVKNYEYYGSLSNEDKDMLSSACIISDTLSDTVYSIDCVCFNKKRHGVGILNVNGGVEFINFNNMDTSTTLRAYGISVVPNNVGQQSKSCCLFQTIVDYMAYKTLLHYNINGMPKGCDSIILNQCSNIVALVVESEDYDTIYTFFQNTELGVILARTLSSRNPMNVENREYLYQHHESLMSYLREVVNK